jgi:hypothetical protein
MEAAYERPGGSLTVWVVPETAASRFVAATRRYRIGYSGDASTEGVVLCRAFAELIRKHEGGGAP